MKAALTTCEDIFLPRAANSGGSQRAALSPECAPSCPNLNLEASRIPRDYVTLLRCGRMLKSVRGRTRSLHEGQIINALCGGGWSCRLGIRFVHMFQSQNGIFIKFGIFFLIVLWTMSGHP